MLINMLMKCLLFYVCNQKKFRDPFIFSIREGDGCKFSGQPDLIQSSERFSLHRGDYFQVPASTMWSYNPFSRGELWPHKSHFTQNPNLRNITRLPSHQADLNANLDCQGGRIAQPIAAINLIARIFSFGNVYSWWISTFCCNSIGSS